MQVTDLLYEMKHQPKYPHLCQFTVVNSVVHSTFFFRCLKDLFDKAVV